MHPINILSFSSSQISTLDYIQPVSLNLNLIILVTMFSSRIVSFFFLLTAFGLFVYAKPIVTDTLAVRESTEIAARGSELVVRGGSCNTKGGSFSPSPYFVVLDISLF